MQLYKLFHECDYCGNMYLRTNVNEYIFKRRIDKWCSYIYTLDPNAFLNTENIVLLLLSYNDTYLVDKNRIEKVLNEDEYSYHYTDEIDLFPYSESFSDLCIINKNDSIRLLMIDKMLKDFYIIA